MGTNHEHVVTAATDEPAVPAASGPSLPAVRPSDQLTEDLFAPALGCGVDVRPGWTQREDGWTPERIRIFLTALAQCGIAGAAARAAGMNRQSAYALRASAKGRPFDLAWRAASQIAMQRLRDELVSRAINGYVEVTIRDGGIREERHRFDNRLALAMLTRSERQAESNADADAAVGFVVEEFDQFLDIASAGDAQAAADFVAGRQRLGYRGHEESAVLERIENHRRYGVGLPEEIDVSDLDPDDRENWTEEQAERAERADFFGDRKREGVAGLLGQLMGLCDEEADEDDDGDDGDGDGEVNEEHDSAEDGKDEGEDQDEGEDSSEGDLGDEALAPPPATGRAGNSGTMARQADAPPLSVPDPASAKPAATPPSPPGLLDDGRPPPGWVAPGR